MGVVSKLLGTAKALGAEAIDLINWLLCFGCALEEFRVIIADLADWMSNSSHPLAAYCTLIACHLFALDKRPGVHPIRILETLLQAIDKIVMRAMRDQAKTAYRSLQLCGGLEAGIERAAHAVVQRRQERNVPVP